MSVKINNSAGGSVTLDSTTTSNEALTLPTGGGTLAKTTDIPTAGADTSLSNLSATGENKVCQAWVNFNGVGTVAIRDSYNVSSITDNSVGSYTINFSTSMPNSNYSTALGCSSNNGYANDGMGFSACIAMNSSAPYQYNTSGFRISCGISNGAPREDGATYILANVFSN